MIKPTVSSFCLFSLASAGNQHLLGWDVFGALLYGPPSFDSLIGWESPSESVSDSKCRALHNGSDYVRVYSSPEFAHGRGISIVTTAEDMAQIQQLPAFSKRDIYTKYNINKQIAQPFEERELPGRGKGLIANKTLHRGDRIFAHTPILIFHEDASATLDDDHWADVESCAVGALPPTSNKLFWQLFGQPSHGPAGGRINTNAFAIDIEDTEHYAVFPEIARLNHDCRPNAAYFFDEDTLTHYVHAITDISIGTELTITYIDPHMPRKERQEALSSTWGFTCSCSLCTADRRLSRLSDSRLAQIEEISGYFEEDGIGSSDMALALLQLYEQERLYAPMGDAHMHAARAFCAEGNRWRAISHARLAVEIGILDNGFRDEDVLAMKRLAKAPEKQECWPRKIAGEAAQEDS